MVYTSRDRPKAQNYLSSYFKIAPQLGIQVAQPRHMALNDDRIDSYIRAIKESLNETVRHLPANLPLALSLSDTLTED